MRLKFVLGGVLWVGGWLGWAQEAPRPMTVDDALNLVRVSNAVMSPDGRQVLFSKSELDWKKNERKTTHYMVSGQGGKPYQYVGEAGGSDFRFSPAGDYLAFLRPVEKKNQLFVMPTGGGEAIQLSRHKTAVSGARWAPDGSRIYFLADDYPGEKAEKEHKAGDDAIVVDEGPNSQGEGKWRNVWVIDLEERQETQLTKESFRAGGLEVSPEGDRLVLLARHENRRNQRNRSEVYLLHVADQTLERLTENEAPEQSLAWVPDGQSVTFLAPDDQRWELSSNKLWRLQLDSRQLSCLSCSFEGTLQEYFWTPDGRAVLFSAQVGPDSGLHRLEIAGGRIESLSLRQGTLSLQSMSRDRDHMVYSFSDFDTPPDLFAGVPGSDEATRLTEANPWIGELQLAQGRTLQWKSFDGLEIEGLLFLPISPQEDRPPLLLHIHGGPAGAFTNRFDPRYHIWAGLGYVSLAPNVRGSRGYGDDFLRGNMFDLGGGDYQDLMTGVDTLIEQQLVDPEKLALRGWSYGGILGGWTITQTPRFKAASVGAMVSDWTSEYGPGFNHDVRLWYIGKTPWENPEGYRRKSPLTHVENITTPTLIMHGMRDTTDTEPQSMMFYSALKDQGKTVRYIRFPREPHGFREPRHQRTRDIEEIRWIEKHLRGRDWIPWVREEPEDETKDSEKEVVSDEGR